MLTITPLYLALAGLLFVYLSINVIRARFKHRVSVGDGGNKELIKAMRVHANFAEYAPIAFLLVAVVELQGGPAWLVHALGFGVLAARVAHAVGFGSTPQIVLLRRGGILLSLLSIAAACCAILALNFS